MRRSATGPVDPARCADAIGEGATDAAGRGAPPRPNAHSEQNFAPGGFVVPQLGQGAAIGLAHSVQNFAPGRFSVPQFEQTTPDGAPLAIVARRRV